MAPSSASSARSQRAAALAILRAPCDSSRIRLLDGPNVYRLEPALKLEVALGRRRTWYGQRVPDAHHRVDLGAPVRPADAPTSIARIRRWVEVLHRSGQAAVWMVHEGRATSAARARIPVTIHRTSEPGHWIDRVPVARGRARPGHRGRGVRAHRGGIRSGHDASRDTPHGRQARSQPDAGAGRSARSRRRPESPRMDPGCRPPDPVISISGTNGKTTTTRMVAHILRAGGHHVGSSTSDGVFVDDALVEAGDLTGPYGARTVLSRDDIDVAVLETARGGIMLRGVGIESNECAVLTNVSSDHMDLQGIHTLPELVQVKAVIARITRPNGVVVLNADDDLVAGVARWVRARVWLTSMRPTGSTHPSLPGPRWQGVRARRGRPARARRTPSGDHSWPRLDIPATLGGVARHNIANALAAAAGARAMGATIGRWRPACGASVPRWTRAMADSICTAAARRPSWWTSPTTRRASRHSWRWARGSWVIG